MYAIAAEPYSLLKLWHGRIYHADMLGIIALRYSLSTCWQSGFTVSSWSRLTWSWQEAWDMISLGLYCCEWIWVCWKHAGNGGSDVTDRGKSLAMLIVVVLASLVEGKLALLISVHLDSEEEARLQCVLLWCVQPERGESDFARSSETGFTGSGEYELAGTSGSGCTGSWHEALNLVDLASLVAVDLGLLRMKVWACCEWRSGLPWTMCIYIGWNKVDHGGFVWACYSESGFTCCGQSVFSSSSGSGFTCSSGSGFGCCGGSIFASANGPGFACESESDFTCCSGSGLTNSWEGQITYSS